MERENGDKFPSQYFLQKGILMRKWRSQRAAMEEGRNAYRQIVAPQKYQADLLSLAHEAPLAGYLGIAKTRDRLLEHFKWPGIEKSVKEFCKAYETCQKVGKPNQTIPPAPLKPIPTTGEPFDRILMDCVGPLPKTEIGNKYILTIM